MFSIKGLRVVFVFVFACVFFISTNPAQIKSKKIKRTQKQTTLKPVQPPTLLPINSSEIFQLSTPPMEPSPIPTGVNPGVSDRPGMSADTGVVDLAPYERAKALLQTIGLNNPVPVQFENQEHSPLVILNASLEVKKYKRPEKIYSGDSDDDYVMQVHVELSNAKSKVIKAFGLYFLKIGSVDPDETPYIVPTRIDAFNSYRLKKTNRSEELRWLQNPEQLKVKVAGFVFADNSIWEEQAESKYIFDQTFNRFPDEPQEVVDSKPVLMDSVFPNYTEEARKNRIEGSVRASVLVGADGKVKRVRIISGLPDGLNEEAILACNQMQFKPAMKNGLAVTYWQKVEIEFNLGRR
jgi:TonB family protein